MHKQISRDILLGSAESAYRGELIGTEIIQFDRISSTNDYASELCKSRTDVSGKVIIANEQTGGRGRFGRRWISPPGDNLYCSIIIKLPPGFKQINLLVHATSLSVATAVRLSTGTKALIKWPNDILINNKKVSGILIESRSAGASFNYAIAGIGLNVNMPVDVLPAEIRPFTTSLNAETGILYNRLEILNELLKQFEHYFVNLTSGDVESIIDNWLQLDCLYGKEISIQVNGQMLSGTANGIDVCGRLKLNSHDGKRHIFSSGEATLIKKKK